MYIEFVLNRLQSMILRLGLFVEDDEVFVTELRAVEAVDGMFSLSIFKIGTLVIHLSFVIL